MIVWDTRVASTVDVLVGCLSLSVLLNINGRCCCWLVVSMVLHVLG